MKRSEKTSELSLLNCEATNFEGMRFAIQVCNLQQALSDQRNRKNGFESMGRPPRAKIWAGARLIAIAEVHTRSTSRLGSHLRIYRDSYIIPALSPKFSYDRIGPHGVAVM